MSNRYSVGSYSLLSSSGDGVSVDSSILSTSSSGSAGYEIESDVGREALKEICCSALSRVLDFPDNQLEILLGYDEENTSGDTGGGNIAKNITSSLRSVRRGLRSLYHHHSHFYQVTPSPGGNGAVSSLMFGSPLCESGHIVLLQLISHMSKFVSSEGLFRKSGNKNRMERLVRELQEGKLSEVVMNRAYNPHDFASVLKQYLSELPEPLLLKRHMCAYLQTVDLSSVSAVIHCLQLLMLLLPPTHRLVLQHLLDLLCQVTKSTSSKMDPHNLSLIFAPTLFLAASTSEESVLPESYEKFSKLLNCMIENADEIFEVPAEVQVVADRYLKKLTKRRDKMSASVASGESVDGDGMAKDCAAEGEETEELVIDVYSSSCKRQCVENYHESGKDRAMDEVAKLYELVKGMPDGPQKTHFMKRFENANKAGCCTPTSVPKHHKESSLSRLKKSLKRNKENATPKISRQQIQLVTPCFQKGSLLSEFDKAEDSSSRSCDVYTTPIGNRISTVKTPGTIKAVPANHQSSSALPPPSPCTSTIFKKPTDKIVTVIPTNSVYVTDV